MEFEDHSDFLEALKRAAKCAVDEDVGHGDSPSLTEFFQQLYVSFETVDESAVRRAISGADSFTLIAAPAGGGKSTILHHGLQAARGHEEDYFLFDFKREIDGFYDMGESKNQKVKFIHNKFKSELAQRFLADIDKLADFAFNAVQMFFPITLNRRILRWRADNENPEIGRDTNRLKELYVRDYQAQVEDFDMLLKELTCAQMIRAIKQTMRLKRFLLVIDNVDRFPVIDQPLLFSVAIDIHHAGEREFGTIVAVRDKNLMRYEDAGAGGNIIRVISLTTHVAETPVHVRLKAPSESFARAMLEKRQQFAIGAIGRNGSEAARRSAVLFNKFKQSINTGLIEERIYNLACHSYRQMLTLHIGFVSFIFRLASAAVKAGESEHLKIDTWTVKSYLYRWIYATHDPNHKFLLDVVSKYYRYKQRVLTAPLLCDIELVILAWLTSHKRAIIRVEDVLDAFRPLGVKPIDVWEGLFQLYAENVFYRHVDLGDSEDRIEYDTQIRKKCRVRITPLGKEFVEDTLTKFEFLHQCLAFPDVVDPKSDDLYQRAELQMGSKAKTVYEFLTVMEEVHSATLLQIRNDSALGSSNWEDYYRTEFCVDGHLILERIIRSHLSHLKSHFPSVYSEWSPKYRELLETYYERIGSKFTANQVLYGI